MPRLRICADAAPKAFCRYALRLRICRLRYAPRHVCQRIAQRARVSRAAERCAAMMMARTLR